MKNYVTMDLQVRRLFALAIFFVFLRNGKGFCTPVAHVVVAQDGSGNYTNIKSAIRAAPNKSLEKFIIKIKKGIYTEKIIVDKKKMNIVLIGEGMDNTIISMHKGASKGIRTWDTPTAVIKGEGFMAQDITFENTAGPKMHQAVALGIQAEKGTFYRCRFKGYQDTLYAKGGSQFFRECEVMGTVDFICGDSKVIFQACTIYARKPLRGQYITITAQNRNDMRKQTGTVFQNCTITATNDLRRERRKYKCYFGRPWGAFSRTVIMQSFIDSIIDPKGWSEWNQEPLGSPYYAEYNNRGPGSHSHARANWSRVINSRNKAFQFTVRNFLQGDGWIPSTVPHYLDLL